MTTPMIRRESRSSLESSSESDSKELEKQDGKKAVNPSTRDTPSTKAPSTSNRSLKRTGTWSNGYMPKDKGEVSSSDPLVSPRRDATPSAAQKPFPGTEKRLPPSTTHLPQAKPASSTKVHSSASSTATTPRTSAPSSTTSALWESSTSVGAGLKSYVIDELKNKPEGAVIRSDVLAKQVVYALSKGYTVKLDGAMIDSIFRDIVWLRPKLSDDEKTPPPDANLIKRFVEPFMHYHFRTEKFKKCLDAVETNYHQASADAASLYGKSAYDFGKSAEAEKVMKPVIQPVLDYMCGAKMNINSSSMPVPVLNFLLSLSEEFRIWDENNGTGNADTLKTAQKKAVTGCFGTRSFMPDFERSLVKKVKGEGEKNKKYDSDYFRPLTKFMNTYLNTKVVGFLETIVECLPEERKKIQRMASISESHQTFESESVKESHLEKTKNKVLTRKPTLKTQLVDMFASGSSKSTSPPLSPRNTGKKKLKEVDASSYNEFQSEKRLPEKPINELGGKLDADNDADFKFKQARKKKRTKNLVEINKEFLTRAFGVKLKPGSLEKVANIPSEEDFPEWPKILREFTKQVVEGTEENYREFRQDAYRYWANFLDKFIESQRIFGNATSPGVMKLRAAANEAPSTAQDSDS